MPQLRVLSASIVLALGLSACGGGGSSGPDSSGQTTPPPVASATQGTLVDDVIVGGTVFCDGNGNRVQDADESVAVTDDAGKYTFDKACFAEIVSVAGTGFDKTTLKAPKEILLVFKVAPSSSCTCSSSDTSIVILSKVERGIQKNY